MLVCSKCGTEIAVAGHACPSCGNRGSVDARFYAGEVKPAPAPAEAASVRASASGALPDRERAWSPWLAAIITVLLLPPAGGWVAAANLRRLPGGQADPWITTVGLLLGELIVAVVTGFVARGHVELAYLPQVVYTIVVALLLVRWQQPTVAARRQAVAGRHTPGVDAFAACLTAVVIWAATSTAFFRIADAVGNEALSTPLKAWQEKHKPKDAGLEMPGMPM